MRFEKHKRLLTPGAYRAVFDEVHYKAATANFLLLARRQATSTPRLGIIVAKKHVPLAVERNKIKRLIRESFRTQAAPPPLDMIILVRKPQMRRESTQIHQDLMVLWRRISALYAQQTTATRDDSTPP